MNYRLKEITMCQALENFQAPANFRSTYKAVPIALYEEMKRFIDFTKYYVCFRGPRFNGSYSTRKRNAYAFDVYQRSDRDTMIIRTEREAFFRGVNWAKGNV